MEYEFASQKIESRHFYYPQTKFCLPGPYHHPKAETNYSSPSPQLSRRTMKTYFKMYCFKTIFLTQVTEECTFCWNVLLVTLSKNLVATITEFLLLFVNAIIDIFIQ